MQSWSNGGNLALFGGTAGAVTLGAPVTAGGLIFGTDGYSLAGTGANALTLTGPGSIAVNGPGNLAAINGVVAGSAGLLKTGGGSLMLNGANTYAGSTIINQGTVIVTNPAELGASSSTVVVNGIAGNGFDGGTLILGGGISPMNFYRNLSLGGQGGPSTAGAALISVGSNTISGTIEASTATQTRVVSAAGTLDITGAVTPNAGGGLLFYGNGNVIIDGQVIGGASGGAGLIKATSDAFTTLVLTNISNSFASDLRLDGGTVLVTDGRALGTGPSANAVRFNGGTLEVRTNAPTSFSTRNVSLADGNGTILVDRAVGTTGLLNQTVAFANLSFASGDRTLTITGRDGYGASFTGLAAPSGEGVQATPP